MLPYLIGLDGGEHYGELMMSRLIYNFLYDPDVVNSFFGSDRIFNLKSDIKGKDIDWEKIQEEVIQWIIQGPHSPQYVVHTQDFLDGKKIEIAKIRIGDESKGRGKSGGYRLVAFIERRFKVIVVMHLFSKNEKPDLTPNEKNKLSKWFKKYIKSQKSEINNQKNVIE